MALAFVHSPRSEQLKRLIKRDSLSADDAENRISAQLPLEDKVRVATVVVDNSGSVEDTRRQVMQLLAAYEPTTEQTRLWYFLFILPVLTVYIVLRLYGSVFH